MAKYFYDCEFLEGTQDKRFLGIKYGKTPPTIDLISIGIVSEDGREYYAISKDFNLHEAWNRYQYAKISNTDNIPGVVVAHIESTKIYWIRENVLKPIFKELVYKDEEWYKQMYRRIPTWDSKPNPKHHNFSYENFKRLLKKYGKPRKQIAEDIIDFCKPVVVKEEIVDLPLITTTIPAIKTTYDKSIQFYGYYSAYDHVVLCWIFGKMIDLPKGFPMLTYDLKQMLDYKVESVYKDTMYNKDGVLDDLSLKISWIKDHSDYPQQTNEHNALSDARWNKELYHFIQKL